MKEQDYIAFEDYLSGNLSDEEQSKFETRLQTEPDFNEAFKLYKGLYNHLDHHIGSQDKITDFKENLKKISNKHFGNETLMQRNESTVKPKRFYRVAIAASAVILLGFFLFSQFTSPSYSDYNNFDAISLTVRGGNELSTKAENAFNSKNYKEAVLLFEELLKENPSNLEVELYKALALIETDGFAEADMILNKISKTNSAYKNKAKWYLALSKLKQNKEEDCITVLKTIPKEAEDYSTAQKLLGKLE